MAFVEGNTIQPIRENVNVNDNRAETGTSPVYPVLIVVFITLALVGKLLVFLLPGTDSCDSTSSSRINQLEEKILPATLKKTKLNANKMKNIENKSELKEQKETAVPVPAQVNRKGRKINKKITSDNLKNTRNPFFYAYKNEVKKKVESCEDALSNLKLGNADTSFTMVDELDPQSSTVEIQNTELEAFPVDKANSSSTNVNHVNQDSLDKTVQNLTSFTMVDELDPQSSTLEIQNTVHEASPVDKASLSSTNVNHVNQNSLEKTVQNLTALEKNGECKIVVDHTEINISRFSDLNASLLEFDGKKEKEKACYSTELEASVCEDKSLQTEVIKVEVVKEPDTSKENEDEGVEGPNLTKEINEIMNEDSEISLSEADQSTILSSGPSIASCSTSVVSFQPRAYQFPSIDNKKIFISRTYSSQIAKAVHEAYKTQIDIEEVELACRFPIAAFENVLYADTPLVGLLNGRHRCVPCQGESIRNSVCIHSVPNMQLGRFWKQYEKPSCFGLDVNVFDTKVYLSSCRTEVAHVAYFVPYLSAVQLFQYSSNSSLACKGKAVENYSDSPQLVFQYFEASLPHERIPFYHKILELAKCESSKKNSGIYGYPSKIVDMRMHELHPASWYCIAWYPIYLIPNAKPNAKFSAAFLSYHSLGFFTQKEAAEGNFKICGNTCITCPVVGLMSYNDKEEKWHKLQVHDTIFSVRDNQRKTGAVLEQRLRSLDIAAFTMSRAELHDDAKDPVLIYHNDFEFFFKCKRSSPHLP